MNISSNALKTLILILAGIVTATFAQDEPVKQKGDEPLSDKSVSRRDLAWHEAGGQVWSADLCANVKQYGPLVERLADGTHAYGRCENYRMTGHWSIRSADGIGQHGHYRDGKRNGQWRIRFPDGTVHMVSLTDDKINGNRLRLRIEKIH